MTAANPIRLAAWAGVVACSLLAGSCGAWHSTFRPVAWTDVPAQCQAVEGLPLYAGAEDLAPDPATDGVYVSVADWGGLARSSARPGGIYFVTLNGRGGATAVNRTPALPDRLFPHGIDVWRPEDPSAGGRLFVVNHLDGDGPSQVDIFEIGQEGRLTWSPESPGHIPELHRPNDVAGAGPRAFWATNDHARKRTSWSRPDWRELLGDVFASRSASVFLVSNGTVASRLPAAFPNGVELSADGTTLFVSESTRGAVRVFDVADSRRPVLIRRLPSPRSPDNLYREGADHLWVASHRDALSFRDHAVSWTRKGDHPPSPAQVLRFNLRDPRTPPRTLYATTPERIRTGGAFSAISAAAPLGDGFLVGSIFQGLQFCRR